MIKGLATCFGKKLSSRDPDIHCHLSKIRGTRKKATQIPKVNSKLSKLSKLCAMVRIPSIPKSIKISEPYGVKAQSFRRRGDRNCQESGPVHHEPRPLMDFHQPRPKGRWTERALTFWQIRLVKDEICAIMGKCQKLATAMLKRKTET